jgi:hypothetical protein
MNSLLILAVVVILILILCNNSIARNGINEHLEIRRDAQIGGSYVKLYEGFNFTQKVFDKHASGSENLYYRILMPINLKSLDINVKKEPAANTPLVQQPRGVSIWSIYPGDTIASTEATGVYMDTYDDPAFAFRANSPKYQHIVTVKPGEQVKMELEDPVKRIFMVINM